MKFLNLKRKLRNSALAMLFAVAVMLVMPATVFADDTDVNVDNDITNNVDVKLPLPIEEADDFSETTDPLVSDLAVCYGICCEFCDETCQGDCCDMCVIHNDMNDVHVPDNSGDEFGDHTTGIDEGFGIGNPTEDTEDNEIRNDEKNEPVIDSAGIFGNSDENIMPPMTNEMGFPGYPYIDVIIPENPENIYQPEIGDESANGDFTGDFNEINDSKNEEEIIFDDDFTGEEEEIIFGDDDLTDDKKSDISNDDLLNNATDVDDPNNADGEVSDNEADTENSDSESADNSTVPEIPDASDNDVLDGADAETSDNSDSENENMDITTDIENSDDSDVNTTDDDVTGEEDIDGSDGEDLEKDDNPVINVVLPASISVTVNPYNLKIANDNDFHYSILSPEYSIKNYSNCDISIVATVSASTEGGMVISPYDLTGSETELTAFVYLEATHKSGAYSDNYINSANQFAFSNDAASKEILTLADGSIEETVGYFKIKGQAVLPDGADYSSGAMLNMVITFDIVPVSNSVVSDSAVEEDENADNAENVENVNDIENTDNAEDVGNVNDIENAENTDNTEDVGNVNDIENVENTDNTNEAENVDNIEKSDDIEDVEPAA